MRKHLLLALPLASLLMVVGCCDSGTCFTSTGSSYVATTSETAAVAAVKVESDVDVAETMTEEEYKALAASSTVTAPAPRATTSRTFATIPTMPLPEGWNYISEKDLSDGPLSADEYISRLPVEKTTARDI